MSNDVILEQLSALADGELPAAEAELLLVRLAREPELMRSWERYHTVSAALRGVLPAHYPRGLAAGINSALRDDAPHATPAIVRWRRPLLGAAIAASVALLGVLVMRSERAPDQGQVVPMVAATEAPFAGEARQVDYDPAMQARLKSYVVRYGEVGGQRLSSVAPHLRVAAQDVEPVEPEKAAAKPKSQAKPKPKAARAP